MVDMIPSRATFRIRRFSSAIKTVPSGATASPAGINGYLSRAVPAPVGPSGDSDTHSGGLSAVAEVAVAWFAVLTAAGDRLDPLVEQ